MVGTKIKGELIGSFEGVFGKIGEMPGKIIGSFNKITKMFEPVLNVVKSD